MDLSQILDWMHDFEGESLTLEADKVFVKRNIKVTGLNKLTILTFQLIFFNEVTHVLNEFIYMIESY